MFKFAEHTANFTFLPLHPILPAARWRQVGGSSRCCKRRLNGSTRVLRSRFGRDGLLIILPENVSVLHSQLRNKAHFLPPHGLLGSAFHCISVQAFCWHPLQIFFHFWGDLPISSNIRSSPCRCHMISYRAWYLLVTFFGRGGEGVFTTLSVSRLYSVAGRMIDEWCVGSIWKEEVAAQLRCYSSIPRTKKSHENPTSG
jgi:hypothetical protein